MSTAERVKLKIQKAKVLNLKAHAEDCKLPRIKKVKYNNLAFTNYKQAKSGIYYRI